MEKGHVNGRKQKSREATVNRLMKEVSQVRKAADDFLKVTDKIAYRAALTVPRHTAGLSVDDTYDAYRCMRTRIKMLQSLVAITEVTAKHLSDTCCNNGSIPN